MDKKVSSPLVLLGARSSSEITRKSLAKITIEHRVVLRRRMSIVDLLKSVANLIEVIFAIISLSTTVPRFSACSSQICENHPSSEFKDLLEEISK